MVYVVVFEDEDGPAAVDAACSSVEGRPQDVAVGTHLVEHHGAAEDCREVVTQYKPVRHGVIAIDMSFVVVGDDAIVRGLQESDDHTAGIAVLMLPW